MVCHSTAFAHNLPSSVLLSDSLSLSLENKGNFSEEILLRKREFALLGLSLSLLLLLHPSAAQIL